MARLNAWQRLGLVASLIVILIAPALAWLEVSMDRAAYADRGFNSCMDHVYEPGSIITAQFCTENWLGKPNPDFWPLYMQGALVALAVVIIVWILVYAITYTVRWILAGRKNNV